LPLAFLATLLLQQLLVTAAPALASTHQLHVLRRLVKARLHDTIRGRVVGGAAVVAVSSPQVVPALALPQRRVLL
jgi:hypothetical protein